MRRLRVGLVLGALLVGSGALAVPTMAAPSGTGLVLAEAYVNGGSSGATFRTKFVEVLNPTDGPVDVEGWSVQYRSATGTAAFSGVIPLGDHVIPAGGRLLVAGNSNGAAGAELPTPDVTSSVSFSGSAGGTLALVSSTTPLTGDRATVLASSAVVDLLGYGTSVTFEGSGTATGYGVAASLVRSGGADTDDNAADFAAAVPTPQACGEACDGSVTPPEPIETLAIAEIQGEGAVSPVEGRTVTTSGVVTAAYPSGGFNGIYLQTGGTGGSIGPASHGIFVFSGDLARSAKVGDSIEVTGKVSEYFGLTELTATTWRDTETLAPVKPVDLTFPLDPADPEALEGMLVLPQGRFTTTNNYTTHQYGEIGLAFGDEPLRQPTDVARPGSAEYTQVVSSNAARAITIDDGATTNYTSGANRDVPAPWLTSDNEVRTNAPVTFTAPVVLDYRNSLWKLQPTAPLGDDAPITIGDDTRPEAPASVGGDLRIGTFNVLNYFTTLGEDYQAAGLGTCTFYTDRAGVNQTVNSCTNDGPRGAANAAALGRQQAKIVAAISKLGADVVTLEEIENSAAFGIDRDTALRSLVTALNAHDGAGVWAAVASPSRVPEVEDVIRTAFIYRAAKVAPVGDSVILDDPAFANARQPLSQEFRPVGGTSRHDVVVIVNHFKSKGSGSGEDADQGDGQGASNASRVRQAHALVAFAAAEQTRAKTDKVFLTGDFNSYSREDPVVVLNEAGYVDVHGSGGQYTYQFGGLMGSLDHVFASPAAAAAVTGSDIWNINADESVAREYGRFNNNVTNLYDASPYRASDHDPALVGVDLGLPDDPNLKVAARSARYPWPVVLDVTAARGADGVLVVSKGRAPIGVGWLSKGRATVSTLPWVLGRGTHTLTVTYLGEPGAFAPATATVSVTVR